MYVKRFAKIQGRKMAYWDVGEGPVLLFGHSYLWTAEMWQAQVAVLSKNFRCILPELWGHGESDALQGVDPYSVEQLTQDMVAFVDALDVSRFSVIGLSVGGMWGARLAHHLPERIEKLVLMDTGLGGEPEASQARFLGMIKIVEDAGAFVPPLIEACLPFFFCDKSLVPELEIVGAFRESLLQWPTEKVSTVVAIGKGIFTRKDFLSATSEIKVPTLVLTGDQDRSRPPADGQEIAAHIPGARFESIPDAGHISCVEQADRVNQALLRFLG